MRWLGSDKSQKNFLAGIVLFNLLDIIFTLLVIEKGFAVEANPFMLILLEKSKIIFASIKISLVSLCVFLLWRLRDYRIAKIATAFCFLTYGCLMWYHLIGIFMSVKLL